MGREVKGRKNFALVLAVVVVLATASFGAAVVVSPSFREKVVRTITFAITSTELKVQNETNLNLTQNMTEANQTIPAVPPPATLPITTLPAHTANETENITLRQPSIEINDTTPNLTAEQWEEINRLKEEEINRTFTPNTLEIASGVVNLTEGVNESIAKLPDNQTIYYALVLRRPVNFGIVLNDFNAIGVRFIKPFGVRGYYVHSTVESAKKAAQLWYVRSVFVVPAEVKMSNRSLEEITNNTNSRFKIFVSLIEDPPDSYKKIIEPEGEIIEYAPFSYFYFMNTTRSSVLELMKIDLVEDISLYTMPIAEPPKISKPVNNSEER